MTQVANGNSYIFYLGNGSTTTYATDFDVIDPAHIVVQVDNATVSTDDYTYASGNIVFDTAPADQADIRIFRQTPRSPLVDFRSFGAITEDEMDLNQTQLIYLAQEAFETDDSGAVTPGSEYLPWDSALGAWDATQAGINRRIVNVEDPAQLDDAATKNYVDNAVQFGLTGTPQAWYFAPTTSTNDFTLASGDGLDARYLIVSIDGVLQIPFQDYTLNSTGADPVLQLIGTGVKNGQELSVQNFGVMRNIVSSQPPANSVGTNEIVNSSVTSAKLAPEAVTTSKIEDLSVTKEKLASGAVDGTKIESDSVGWEHMRTEDFAPDVAGPPFPVLKLNADGDLTQDTVDAVDVNNLQATINATPVSNLDVATSSLRMGGQNIENLPNPPNAASSAASKAYVDGVIGASATPGIDLISSRLVLGGGVSNTSTKIFDVADDAELIDGTTYEFYSAVLTGLVAPGSVSFTYTLPGGTTKYRLCRYMSDIQTASIQYTGGTPFGISPVGAFQTPTSSNSRLPLKMTFMQAADGTNAPSLIVEGLGQRDPSNFFEALSSPSPAQSAMTNGKFQEIYLNSGGHTGPMRVTLYGHKRS